MPAHFYRDKVHSCLSLDTSGLCVYIDRRQFFSEIVGLHLHLRARARGQRERERNGDDRYRTVQSGAIRDGRRPTKQFVRR